MKLGLISDVHGDPVALELAWSHLTVLGADAIVCAGDVVGYGPRPDDAVALLKQWSIPSVRGNHDRWALERGPAARDPFGGPAPSNETLDWLREVPTDLAFDVGGRIVVVVHGSPRDDLEFVTERDHPPEVLDAWLARLGCDVLVHGHTHSPMACRTAHGLTVNPGSVVSAPVVSTSRTFALLALDDLTVTFHDVESGAPRVVKPWAGCAAG